MTSQWYASVWASRYSSTFSQLSARAICTAIALLAPASLQAQARTSITGTVVSATGEPLPYSTVSLQGSGGERFTDARGRFSVAGLAAGSYRLRVRQLGFTAIDTVITVSNAPVDVRLTLNPIAFRLSTVTVRGRAKCLVPGVDSVNSGSDLELIITEVRKNAEREKLLATEYPFEYKLAGTLTHWSSGGRIVARTSDTLTYRSNERPPYFPGSILRYEFRHGEQKMIMSVPVLADVATPEFLTTHCFSLAGVVRDRRESTYRVDFKPIPALNKPDVEGSIFLDVKSFVIRRAVFRLTQLSKIETPILGLEVSTSYRQINGGLTVFGEIDSLQPMPGQQSARERQQLIDVAFIRGAPGETK